MLIENPYRPGAGHTPPFFAGRQSEQYHYKRALQQPVVTENILVTGLRGYGKTVLLDQMRQMAVQSNWLWVGNDLSESSSLSEERLALRILTDLAAAIAAKVSSTSQSTDSNWRHGNVEPLRPIDINAYSYHAMKAKFDQLPGLPSDRLKIILADVTYLIQSLRIRGLILAYDEAQCLADKAEQNEYPMSMLIESVAALQRRVNNAPCLLILCGLPQVFQSLTETRTYTERMFHVMTLDRLSKDDTFKAVMTPIATLMPPLRAPQALIEKVVNLTGGYPYLIQFFGRELVDQMLENGGTLSADQFPSVETFERLDAGLFSARWNRTSDKQREILAVIARRPSKISADFSAQELELLRNNHDEPNGSMTQVLLALCERGMLYRTRHGRYAFTVPLSEAMILRRLNREREVNASWAPFEASSESARDQPQPMPPPMPTQKTELPKVRKRGWFR
jgi:hypothetical protein